MSDTSSEQPLENHSSPPAGPFSPVGQAGVGSETSAAGHSHASSPAQQIWPPPPVGVYEPLPVQPYKPVNGTIVLLLGILSIVICGICGPIAWIMGNNALKTLDQCGDPLYQRNLVNSGRICGIIGTVFLGLGVVYYVAMLVFGLVSSVGSHR